ncbi:MAG TPA: HAD family hydrolase [Gammaproteobacteria bacterium]
MRLPLEIASRKDNHALLQPAIFLDKDGTLVVDDPYSVDTGTMRLYPEVLPALAAFAAQGYKLFVVSNQPGVAHGYFDTAAVDRVGFALAQRFADSSAPLSGFYYCPHHPDGVRREFAVTCDCRKPAPGLLAKAASEHHVDLSASWMLGDILHDVEAGKRAGCRTILVDRGNETEWDVTGARQPDWVVSDLKSALKHVGGQPTDC